MVALNVDYPTPGRWTFEVLEVVADDTTAVTRVVVRNEVEATAVTFFTVAEDAITRMVEYWPDPYEPPSCRTSGGTA